MSKNAVHDIRLALNAITKDIEAEDAQTQLAALEALLAQSAAILRLARSSSGYAAQQKQEAKPKPKPKLKARKKAAPKVTNVPLPSANAPLADRLDSIARIDKQVPRMY